MQTLRIAGLLWFLSSLCTPAFAGSTKLQLRPAIPMGYAGDVLRLQVKLPCGSRYFGLVAKGDAQGKVLEVAAAVTDNSVVCTSMPQVVEVGADFLATGHYKKVAPMAVTAGTRVRAVAVEELRLVPNKSGAATLHSIYTKHCGYDLGTVIRRSAAHQIEIAMVEESVSKERASACLAAPMARKISWVSTKRGSPSIKPLPNASRSLARQFTMALAPTTELKSTPKGISVSYQRHCNEAPIGLVIGAASVTQTRVGVLVARYPNLRCLRELPDAVSETITEPGVVLPKSMEMGPLHEATNVEFNLRSPSEITLERSPKVTTLRISYIDSCQLRYAIYARDVSGRLAVGTLAIKAAATLVSSAGTDATCVSEPVKAELLQPFLAAHLDAGQIYPLRLRGI